MQKALKELTPSYLKEQEYIQGQINNSEEDRQLEIAYEQKEELLESRS